MCGNRPAKTSRNSKPQYNHAERVKQLSNTPKLQYNSTQRAYVDYLTMEDAYKRTHIPLTITRTQWAVGPGFFHTGTIRANDTQFTYVYDCGTARSFDLLQNEVDTYISSLRSTWPANRIIDTDTAETTQQAQVDIVFISHFDTDHIKGLAYLIQNAAIKEVAIPFTTPRERFLHLCKSTFDSKTNMNRATSGEYHDFILEFTASPARAIRRFPEFLNREASDITLTEIQHERDNEADNRHDFIHSVHIPTNTSSDNNDKKHETTPVWLFSASTLQGNADKLGAELIGSLIKQGIIESESDLENAAKLGGVNGW